MQVKNNMVFVQIGTNDGNDEFNKLVKEWNPSKVILVEPNKSLNKDILINYKGLQNVFIENVIISEGLTKLMIPASYKNGRSINGVKYTNGHFSLLPMDDWGDDFVTIEAPSMTFMELCEKYKITNIEYLQIDTEGYDAEIIKSIDFTKVDINTIVYEYWHFPISCFSRHGEKGKQYGEKGMKDVSDLLTSLGYVMQQVDINIIAQK